MVIKTEIFIYKFYGRAEIYMLTEKEITSRYYTTKLGKLIQKFGLSRIYF